MTENLSNYGLEETPYQTNDQCDLYAEEDLSHLEDEIADLPPSAKLVYRVLAQDGPQTNADLRENALLSERTLRSSINRLEERGVVRDRPSLQDARKSVYRLNVELDEDDML